MLNKAVEDMFKHTGKTVNIIGKTRIRTYQGLYVQLSDMQKNKQILVPNGFNFTYFMPKAEKYIKDGVIGEVKHIDAAFSSLNNYALVSSFLLMNFIARIDPGEVILNYESEKFRWEKIEDALKLPLNEPTKNLILELKDRKKEYLNEYNFVS